MIFNNSKEGKIKRAVINHIKENNINYNAYMNCYITHIKGVTIYIYHDYISLDSKISIRTSEPYKLINKQTEEKCMNRILEKLKL